MKKFPVTSENGNEYLVELRKSYMFESNYEVRIYEQYTGWFKKKRLRFLNEHFMGSARSYRINEFEFDFIKMAKYEVARLEAEWEAYVHLQQNIIKAEQKFEEWNGDCNESK